MAIAMIDIETLDIAVTAKILSIGVATDTGLRLYLELDVSSQGSRTESADTLKWWRAQSTAMPAGELPLYAALLKLSDFLRTLKPTELWCKGPHFDIAILQHAYGDMGTPWKYSQIRDLRTLKSEALRLGADELKLVNSHHALDDARNQLTEVQHYRNFMNSLRKEK